MTSILSIMTKSAALADNSHRVLLGMFDILSIDDMPFILPPEIEYFSQYSHHTLRPPSIKIFWPFIYAEASEQRN